MVSAYTTLCTLLAFRLDLWLRLFSGIFCFVCYIWMSDILCVTALTNSPYSHFSVFTKVESNALFGQSYFTTTVILNNVEIDKVKGQVPHKHRASCLALLSSNRDFLLFVFIYYICIIVNILACIRA